MAVSFAMHNARMHMKQLDHQQLTTTKPTPLECTCGAQAFRDQHKADRQQRQLKRVTPNPPFDALRSEKRLANAGPDDEEKDTDTMPVARKRSLWRKMLGKAPKCICEKLQREREARRLQPIKIPSEYEGCVTVRVAGKQVAYTREMQLIKRRSYTPMDAISEDED